MKETDTLKRKILRLVLPMAFQRFMLAGLFCDVVTLWCVAVPIGCLCAFILKIPVPGVYFVLNLDEIAKLPALYRHYRKYGWLKNIT